MRAMRILHLANHVQRIGNGIANVAVDLACLQADAGHVVAFASGGGEYEELLGGHGVTCLRLDQRTASPRNLLTLPLRWRRLVRGFQPDVVHAHMVAGAVLARFVRARREYALVTTVHNEFERKAKLMGLGDRVIAVSTPCARSLKGRGVGGDRVRVVTNGTLGSPRSLPPEQVEPAALSRPAIVTVAGMYRRKGIAELIAAFERVAAENPGANLYLVGDGPDRDAFEQQARRTSVSGRIHFVGFDPQPQRYLRSADVFVLASHREPFGLVITEAMECGCPVIGSDVDGIAELLGPGGRHGLLVPPGNVPALAAALRRVLDDGAERRRLGQAALRRARDFTVDRAARETMAVYEEAVGQRSGEISGSRAGRPCHRKAGAVEGA